MVDVLVISTMLEEEKDVNMLIEDFIGDRVMDPKYKRHSWHQTTSGELIVRSRYLSGPIGSCHDSCKQGHKNESEIKTKAHPVKKLMLRSQSERKYFPEVALPMKTCGTKSAFKRLSLPETGLEKQSRLHTKEIKQFGSRQRGSEVKGIKKSIVKDEEKPILPLSASCISKPPKKRAMSMDARDKGLQIKVETSTKSTNLKKQMSLTERRAPIGTREGNNNSCFTDSMLPTIQRPFRMTKSNPCNHEGRVTTQRAPKGKKTTQQNETEEKGSSTWKMKFKKATTSILSSGNISPKQHQFRRPESTSEGQNDIVINAGKGSYNREKVDGEESHENGAERDEVVVLRHIEKIDKIEGNVIKGTITTEPPKCKKDMVKVLVGAFEALISLGDRKSLVAASAS
ncbi:hypothetical protein V2J09_014932 [Rumex salicifolius]